MAVTQTSAYAFQGLSGDVKPASTEAGQVVTSALFYETDTGSWFIYDGTDWQPYTYPTGDILLPTADQKAAMDAAADPDGANPFATVADLSGASALDDLTDVDLADLDPATQGNQGLWYDTTLEKWRAGGAKNLTDFRQYVAMLSLGSYFNADQPFGGPPLGGIIAGCTVEALAADDVRVGQEVGGAGLLAPVGLLDSRVPYVWPAGGNEIYSLFDPPDDTLDRIDLVVDTIEDFQTMEVVTRVRTGTPDVSPVAPTVQDGENGLATVLIPANETDATAWTITDIRNLISAVPIPDPLVLVNGLSLGTNPAQTSEVIRLSYGQAITARNADDDGDLYLMTIGDYPEDNSLEIGVIVSFDTEVYFGGLPTSDPAEAGNAWVFTGDITDLTNYLAGGGRLMALGNP